jgi:hypothetical protein
MSTIHHDDKLDDATLTPAQREWLERQGRAARELEARERKVAIERVRAAADAANRRRRPAPPRPSQLPRPSTR